MPLVNLQTLSPQSFPHDEDDAFEFKSSRTPAGKLATELEHAATAFANSGGGCFIAGVHDKTGDPDGGFRDPLVGRQSLRDWIDQTIARVSPPVKYEIAFYNDNEGRGQLEQGHVVAAVSFPPSHSGPHMASNHRYYIRGGAHTVPAGSSIVEALFAQRHARSPVLSHIVREKPGQGTVLQVGIIALTSAPAVNIEITLDPVPELLKEASSGFPRRVPVIDQNNPFYFDVALYHAPKVDSQIVIAYRDLSGNQYLYEGNTAFADALGPVRVGRDTEDRKVKALEDIARQLDRIRK